MEPNYKPLLSSPTSRGSSFSSCPVNNSNGLQSNQLTRSEPINPYPTTFVQADATSFKQVVQMLTGSNVPTDDTVQKPSSVQSSPDKKRQSSGFKLYERRNSPCINPIGPLCMQHALKPEILSPSMLDFPSLILSPVTPLIPDPFDRSRGIDNCCNFVDVEAEEKAIKQKGFYLHPSPSTTPRETEPRLLSLFPVTSPRVPGVNYSGNHR